MWHSINFSGNFTKIQKKHVSKCQLGVDVVKCTAVLIKWQGCCQPDDAYLRSAEDLDQSGFDQWKVIIWPFFRIVTFCYPLILWLGMFLQVSKTRLKMPFRPNTVLNSGVRYVWGKAYHPSFINNLSRFKLVWYNKHGRPTCLDGRLFVKIWNLSEIRILSIFFNKFVKLK